MSQTNDNEKLGMARKALRFELAFLISVALLITIAPYASAQEEPIAIAGDDMVVYVNEEFSVNGTAQSDFAITSYQWDFDGDGVYEETSDITGYVTHTYSEIGTYNVTFKVTDFNGSTDRDFMIITVEEKEPLSTGAYLAAIGAGLAIGIAGMGAGIGVGITGATGAGTVAEKPDMFAKSIVFQALPQTQAIYGLLIAIMILMYTGLLGGAGEDIPIAVGLVAIGCGLAVGLAGLSAIGQGIAAGSGISATAGDPKMLGKGIVFSVLPETQAIYGLLVAILLMNFSGLLGGNVDIVRDFPTVGLVAVGCGLSIGVAGLSAIGQGIAASGGVGATASDPKMFGKGIVYSVLPETQAIYGLLIAILLMAFTGMFTQDFVVSAAVGLIAIGCGLSIGVAGLSAIGQGIAASGGIGATAEDPKMFGKGIVYSVLPETQAIYGLLVAILLMAFGGLFVGDVASLDSAVDNGIGIGLVAVGCGLSIGIAGLSAIGQGIAASGGVGATSEDTKMFGKGIVFSVLPETQAIYGLLIAVLLMAFTGMFTGEFNATEGMGLAALGAGLAVGISGLSAIGQGITASAGIGASARNPQAFGRSIIFSVMSETFAIFGLLIAIFIMYGVKLMGG
ncbi:MAG: PKD domain-containing protein [Thermoplasmata archaeon]|nr:MAG: PKD domain-containing protein [Thermoplasmata archaeon]